MNLMKIVIHSTKTNMVGDPFDVNENIIEGKIRIGNKLWVYLTPFTKEYLYLALRKVNLNSSAGPVYIKPKCIVSSINNLIIVLNMISVFLNVVKTTYKLLHTYWSSFSNENNGTYCKLTTK